MKDKIVYYDTDGNEWSLKEVNGGWCAYRKDHVAITASGTTIDKCIDQIKVLTENAMKCGCKIIPKLTKSTSGVYEIEQCPLCKAAPELIKALKVCEYELGALAALKTFRRYWPEINSTQLIIEETLKKAQP